MTRRDELYQIMVANEGLLPPAAVVKFAKENVDSELHQGFNWNIQEAAEQHWLETARRIIRVELTVLPNPNLRLRAFVSLTIDQQAGTGYRDMVTVLTQPNLRQLLIADAMAEFDKWQKKYEHIMELAEIFAAAKTVKQKAELLGPKKEECSTT